MPEQSTDTLTALVSPISTGMTETAVASTRPVDADERTQRIATAAYLRAERRGFSNGSPEQDWLEAEAEVDRVSRAGGA